MRLLKRYLLNLRDRQHLMNWESIFDLLERKRRAMVLDIGCGDGDVAREIASKVQTNKVYGIEINKRRAVRASKVNNVNVILADANKPFPFASNSFHIVIANQLIEHLYDTDGFIKEMRRILKPGGICITSTANLAGIHNIVSLLLGYQPPGAHVSDEIQCGNPLTPDKGNINNPPSIRHRRIFTAPALRELFQFHGFEVEKLTGWGFHPLPLFIQRHVRWARHSTYLTIRARKPTDVV